ncbi:fusarubin cluster-esterase [Trichoderma cornu-damae]|uniref:Fusarubin cluster-esterase n=1 Tax=Trichoderma cornu-damae TaxID=654480 RepID=A0A9P8QGY0_9HYPO|nr:fusarubin cluster-esterase [Trichoderma cornu-damae]
MRLIQTVTLLAALLGQAYADDADDLTDSAAAVSSEAAAIRTFFYTGGGYTDDGVGGHIYREQMYVERLRPARGVSRATPIVFIHGQAQTGTNFLNKPDGGRGWASQFLDQGYEVYIVDQTLRARSPWQPAYVVAVPSTYSAEIIEQRFTAPQNYNLWPQAASHTQWPGNGSMGDAVFDTFYSSNVQFISNAVYQQTTVQNAGAALLDKIGKPVILVGHSQGGLMPIVIADARPKLTKALILLEPTGPPFREAIFSSAPARAWGLADIKLTYTPPVSVPVLDLVQQVYPAPDRNHTDCVLQASSPPPRQLSNLASKPILLVTSEASYHAPYDYCTASYLKQAGCSKTTHLELAKAGIRGNGHLFFMEKNSDQIQQKVQGWIASLS